MTTKPTTNGLGEIPNQATQEALLEAHAKERGVMIDDALSFTDIDALMAFLEK